MLKRIFQFLNLEYFYFRKHFCQVTVISYQIIISLVIHHYMIPIHDTNT